MLQHHYHSTHVTRTAERLIWFCIKFCVIYSVFYDKCSPKNILTPAFISRND